MRLRFETNHEKATQALNYLALQQGGSINKMKALKLIFFADRYHLRMHGRPVLGDSYWAMSYGPVPSMAMNLAEGDQYLDECERAYAQRYLRSSDDGYVVASIAEVDEDVFSDSDVEALDFAWEHFGHLSEWRLAALSHAYPEWKKHREGLTKGNCKRAPMEYEDFFLDPSPDDSDLQEAGLGDLFADAVSEQQKAAAREIADERSREKAFWET